MIQCPDYPAFLIKKGFTDRMMQPQLIEELNASQQLWNEDDSPLLADYLQQNAPFLDQVQAAFARPKFWMPYVSEDDRSLFQIMFTSSTRMRRAATSLAARATFRANLGNFNAFLADVTALKQFAHNLSAQPAMGYSLLAAFIETLANQDIGAFAGSGRLTAQQTTTLIVTLQKIPPPEKISTAVDTNQRWLALDAIALISQGHLDFLGDPDNKIRQQFAAIHPDLVDWNALLTRMNTIIDQNIDAMSQPTLSDIHAAMEKIRSAYPKMDPTPDLSPHPAEPRDAYTTRVQNQILSLFAPSLEHDEQTFRQSLMSRQMALTLLAAAQYHAEKNHWPDTLPALLPTYLHQLPTDIYSNNQSDPIHYSHDTTTARLYSLGPNHHDNNAQNDPESKTDDILIGPPSNQ